jgi:RecB family endonuclease NucS
LNCAIPRELVQGSLSIDLSGRFEKYLNSEFRLVICEFDQLKKIHAEKWDQEVEFVLKDWDKSIRKIVETAKDAVVVVLNGEGNVAAANRYGIDRLDARRDREFDRWSDEMERMWRKAQMRLHMNFVMFCTKDEE